MALKQYLSLKQEQRLSPQQIQLMKLLQVPTIELDQRIKQEIEENPALEEGENEEHDDFEKDENDGNDDENDGNDDFDLSDYMDTETPDYKTQVQNKAKDEEERAVPYSGEQSFQDYLLNQLYMINLEGQEEIIAKTIIGNLDEAGYLGREIAAIVDDLAFNMNVETTEKKVENVLKKIQQLDPAGVGARDLRECLLLQIERKQSGNITNFTAKKILEDHFEAFIKKHYDKIQRKLDIEDEDFKDAVEVIIKLNPKPGGTGSSRISGNARQITPDFYVQEFEGKLEVTLHGKNAPKLHVNNEYATMLKNYAESAKVSKSDKETFQFVKQKLDNAKWFIDAIQQRQNTLLTTMQAIVDYQKEFFLTGDETNLKPMILKDISDKIGLDISTISRVSNSKFVQTNYGIYSLKYFFSEALSTDDGDEVSTREVKKILQDAVDGEDKKKPLTDQKLAALLNEKGYNIARRTIAKYREQLNIPVARLRKEL